MSTDRGWIKLHRKIEYSSVWNHKNPLMLKLWIKCLISANHQETKILYGKEELILNPGEFIYGRNKWSDDLNIRTSTLRNFVDHLVKWGQIQDLRKDKGFGSIYKIKEWDNYQNIGQGLGQKKDKPRTSEGLTKDTPKNIKNANNDKELNNKKEFLDLVIERYNFSHRTSKRKIAEGTIKNILYWLDFHTEEEIITALENQPVCTVDFYRKIGFDTVFRRENGKSEPVDYIEEILKNYKKETNHYEA